LCAICLRSPAASWTARGVERFLWDLRLTAQELVIENHATHLKELDAAMHSDCPSNPTTESVRDMTSRGGGRAMGEFWGHV